MTQADVTGNPFAKKEDKEEEQARAWLEETRRLASSN